MIYIAPLKALVRERMNDWGKGMCKALGKKLVELTGVLRVGMLWQGDARCELCMQTMLGVRLAEQLR